MENNLFVWETQTGTLVNSFDWNNKAQDGAVSVKFDLEEKFCAK